MFKGILWLVFLGPIIIALTVVVLLWAAWLDLTGQNKYVDVMADLHEDI